MNWLDTYSEIELRHIIQALDDYHRDISTFNDRIDHLDDVLDIWYRPSEAWADPDMNKWVDLFNSIEQSKHDLMPPSATQLAEIDERVANLKVRAQNALCVLSLSHALHDIAAYIEGRLSVRGIWNRIWELTYEVRGLLPENLYRPLIDLADSFEIAFATYNDGSSLPTDSQLRMLKEAAAEIKETLASLSS